MVHLSQIDSCPRRWMASTTSPGTSVALKSHEGLGQGLLWVSRWVTGTLNLCQMGLLRAETTHAGLELKCWETKFNTGRLKVHCTPAAL